MNFFCNVLFDGGIRVLLRFLGFDPEDLGAVLTFGMSAMLSFMLGLSFVIAWRVSKRKWHLVAGICLLALSLSNNIFHYPVLLDSLHNRSILEDVVFVEVFVLMGLMVSCACSIASFANWIKRISVLNLLKAGCIIFLSLPFLFATVWFFTPAAHDLKMVYFGEVAVLCVICYALAFLTAFWERRIKARATVEQSKEPAQDGS